MTNEIKKKLYLTFAILLLVVWLIPQFSGIFIRNGLTLTLPNIIYIILYAITILFAVVLIKKYRLMRSLKVGVIITIGTIAVIGIFAFRVVTFYIANSTLSSIFALHTGYLSMIPRNIALYLGVVGLWGTYKIKTGDNPNNNTVNDADAPQNETQTNHTFDINENLRRSIYHKYCEEVKKSLKSPASAVFCTIDELTIIDNYGVYIVSGWVDSQNSYGAMIRTNVKLELAIENGQLVLKTNLAMLHSKALAGKMAGYYVIGAVITAILFAISYFFINGMF